MDIELPDSMPSEQRELVKKLSEDIQILEQKERYEESLLEFVKGAWSSIDGSEFQDSWAIQAMCDHLENIVYGNIKRLLINIPPRASKTSVCSIIFPVWVWARSDISFLSGPQVKFLCASYNQDLTLEASTKSRRLIASPWFQKYWPNKIVFHSDQNTKTDYSNTFGGARRSTSVKGSLLGLGGDILIADDLNKVGKEDTIETDEERNDVKAFWSEFSSTRLNNPKKSAIIGVQQRLHQSDMSGLILNGDEEYCHLMIPMTYDPDRHCVTVKLPQYIDDSPWEDPRKFTGESLMWPERFGEKEVRSLETKLGPFMCTPKESPILMGDLSLKPISEVNVGDEIIGFITDTGREADSKCSYTNRRLCHTTVKSVFTRVAQVVKITLSSGEIIRCTPEHKWYMGKHGGRRGKKSNYKDGREDIRPLYRPAIVGRKLMRICSPRLPELSYEDQFDAGWLAGFFDGEGSVGMAAKHSMDIKYGKVFRRTSQITFTQGAGRNIILCDKLEKILNKFGFKFSYTESVRSDRKEGSPNTHMTRCYRLNYTSGAEFYQKFLHIVHPTKWRDRIISGALGGKFIQSQEEVVSIEPDGEELVYALETGTGNYVVWGIASSNSSGRLQQMPTPKGGGIIKSDWWQLWDKKQAAEYGLEWDNNPGGHKDYPDFDLVVGGLDTAYGQKEENDYSAMTVWGIWKDKNKNRRGMLIFAWQKRLPLHGRVLSVMEGEAAVNFRERQKAEWGLVELVADTCKRYKVRRLLIEDKTRGRDVAEEINRLYARDNWGVELLNPVGDKVTRGHSVVPMFTDGMIYAPNMKWSQMVIDQCALVPKSDHDDMYDTVTMFLHWARENLILIRGDEMSVILEDEMAYKGRQQSISEQYGV